MSAGAIEVEIRFAGVKLIASAVFVD